MNLRRETETEKKLQLHAAVHAALKLQNRKDMVYVSV